jgi:hypothetical protein
VSVHHRSNRSPRWAVRLVAASLTLLVGACRDADQETESVAPRQISLARDFVTPELARNLDANGQFVLGPPPNEAAQTIDEVTAKELARLWVRDHAPFMRSTLERDRGAPIVLRTLAVCGRAFYAETVWELGGHLPFIQRNFGSQWLVSLCAPDGSPQVSVAVSAHNTHLKIENDAIAWPTLGSGVNGGEFFATGIPIAAKALPVGPEQAVELAARMTGRRAAVVPRLILVPPEVGPPQSSRWLVSLDLPATVVRTIDRRPIVSRDVFVGLTSFVERPPEVFVAAGEGDQPADIELRLSENAGVPSLIRVVRRAGAPARQEAVSAVGSPVP